MENESLGVWGLFFCSGTWEVGSPHYIYKYNTLLIVSIKIWMVRVCYFAQMSTQNSSNIHFRNEKKGQDNMESI